MALKGAQKGGRDHNHTLNYRVGAQLSANKWASGWVTPLGSVLPPPPIPQEEPGIIICRLVKGPVWDRENQGAISGGLRGSRLALR